MYFPIQISPYYCSFSVFYSGCCSTDLYFDKTKSQKLQIKNGEIAEIDENGFVKVTSKDGSVKLSIGKLSFSKEAINENLKELVSVLKQLRPASVKANYFKGVFISTTMGVGVNIKMSEIYAI